MLATFCKFELARGERQSYFDGFIIPIFLAGISGPFTVARKAGR